MQFSRTKSFWTCFTLTSIKGDFLWTKVWEEGFLAALGLINSSFQTISPKIQQNTNQKKTTSCRETNWNTKAELKQIHFYFLIPHRVSWRMFFNLVLGKEMKRFVLNEESLFHHKSTFLRFSKDSDEHLSVVGEEASAEGDLAPQRTRRLPLQHKPEGGGQTPCPFRKHPSVLCTAEQRRFRRRDLTDSSQRWSWGPASPEKTTNHLQSCCTDKLCFL